MRKAQVKLAMRNVPIWVAFLARGLAHIIDDDHLGCQDMVHGFPAQDVIFTMADGPIFP